MKHSAKVHLHDIQEAARQILEFTVGMSLENYRVNALVKAGVERKFAVIGEALVRLRGQHPEFLHRISDWDQIIGFRNVLVHGYDAIDDATVWSAIKHSLPILLKEVSLLLNS